MTGINELLGSAYSVAIAGHIGPDGDCVGSCMGMYLYLKKTSVTQVEVAPDLKTCKAFISVLGNAEEKKNTLAGLRSAEGYIRRYLAKNLNLRNTPEIHFILDDSIEYGVHMSHLIDEVQKDAADGRDNEDIEEAEDVWNDEDIEEEDV